MRLIDTETGKFVNVVDSSTAPLYAALSHTWDPNGEQSYQQVVKIQENFGLSSALAGEVPSEPLSNTPSQTPQTVVLDASEPPMPTHSTLSASQVPHLSPSMPALLSSLLVSILARAVLYFLFGSSVPPRLEPHSEAQTPRPSPTRPSIWDPDSPLSEKVRKACEIARNDGYRYMWVDSSCIDKTSSSELSEAINSMFKWYCDAQICYALLSDVPSDGDVRARNSKFRKSRWFKRSWTLQELVAPRMVVFLSRNWKGLGTKDALADLIEEITHIDRDVLTHRKALADECVAERMRWAAERKATRVEDVAYSLLGIFGITMPTLYGEGEYAFLRLQEEILRRIPDRTLFAWGECVPFPQGPSAWITVVPEAGSLVASSPRSFASLTGKIDVLSQEDIESLKLSVEPEEYTPTPHGIRTQLFFIPVQALNPSFFIDVIPDRRVSAVDLPSWHFVLLASQHAHSDRRLLGRLCSIPCTKSNNTVLHVPRGSESYVSVNTFAISLGDLVSTQNLAQLKVKTVYLPHPKPSMSKRRPPYEQDATLKSTISLSTWAQDSLRLYGYTISDLRPIEDHPQYSSFLTLSNVSFNVHIQYRHMPGKSGTPKRHAMVIEARIWILSPDSEEDVQRGALQRNPPYTSSIWLACEPSWAVTLPLRTIHLVTQSRDEATLRLRLLGIATPTHFHTHVEVASDVANPTCQLSTRALAVSEGLLDRVIGEPHTDLKFTMLGSVRRALEARGYSVDLERSDPNTGDSHSLSLIISNVASGFSISIKYFHMLQKGIGSFRKQFQELVVVARVTLELPSGASHNSEGYQDGPYVAGWSDDACSRDIGWQWRQEEKKISLTTPTGDSLTLRLGLDLAWTSEYYLVVDIEHDGGSCSRYEPDRRPPTAPLLLRNPHSRIILMLPAHVKRALQMHGYDVHFEGPNEDHPDHYHLTFSDANLTIDIEYSYHLSTALNGKQGLTFWARVTTSSLQSSRDAATQPGRGIRGTWDAWESESAIQRIIGRLKRGWRWNLPQKDVKLALPTGLELTLRLGFYLVWLSEYCLMVEIIPPSPLSGTTSHEALVSAHTSAHSRNGREDAGDGAGMQETAAGEDDDHDVAHSGLVAPVTLPSPGMEEAEVEGASSGDQVE